MPCRCDYEPYHEPSHHKEKRNDKAFENLKSQLSDLGKKYNSLKSECDKVTQLLCYACGTMKYLRVFDDVSDIDSRFIDWWKNHDAWDFNRTLKMMKKEFGESLTEKETIRKWFIRQAEDVHPLSAYHTGAYFDDVYAAFIKWQKDKRTKENRIAELEAELARLKAEV